MPSQLGDDPSHLPFDFLSRHSLPYTDSRHHLPPPRLRNDHNPRHGPFLAAGAGAHPHDGCPDRKRRIDIRPRNDTARTQCSASVVDHALVAVSEIGDGVVVDQGILPLFCLASWSGRVIRCVFVSFFSLDGSGIVRDVAGPS